jgi:pimeloyl-ACP methyl ester carboxylesterase
MPHLTLINGLPIFYTLKTGDNSLPTLVFVHGNSTQSESWAGIVNDPVLNDYPMLTFDLPGHGRSGKATQPETQYTLKGYGEVVLELTQTLGIKEAVFVGHSLGANILLQSADTLTMAVRMCLMSTSPVISPNHIHEAYYIGEETKVLFRDKSTETEIEQYVKSNFVSEGLTEIEMMITWFHQTDPLARLNMTASIVNIENEWTIIQKSPFPIAFFCSDLDKVLNHTYLLEQLPKENLWKSKVHYVSGAGHCLPMEKPEETAKLLFKYLKDLCDE